MKAYTFNGNLSKGLAVTNDEKFGQIVFLGEAGRGRRYEKVSLSRQNPAYVIDGRILEADPVKITLGAKAEESEKVFYVLAASKSDSWSVLVRINTNGGYIRGANGRWETISGKPETLVSGYGAFGDAGRIGNWADGLVVMNPGDVIRVRPSRTWGEGPSALWVDENGEPHSASWKDYENLQAVAQAESLLAEAEAQPEALNIIHGTMPAFTWRGGSVESGLHLTKGATGLVVELGEAGRGRRLTEIPLVGEVPGMLTQTAVAQLSEKVRGLIPNYTKTENSFLVRINTSGGYTRRGNGFWKPWKGHTVTVAAGYGADGDAGGIGTWDDELLVMHEGDVIYATPAGSAPLYAVLVKDGKVFTELWVTWKIEDAKCDPEFYVAKGTAPWGHVPADWIGKVVTVKELESSREDGSYLTERYTGEVVSISPLRLNLGWDNRDYHEVEVTHGTWINLETKMQVKRLVGEDATQRQTMRTQAEEVKKQAIEITQRSYFNLLSDPLQEDMQKLGGEVGFDLMPSDGYDGLKSWVERGQSLLSRIAEATEATKELERRQNAGEILINFTAWHRMGGATNNGDGWVIRPDGSFRDSDSNDIRRHKSDGQLRWNLVEPEELALRWDCGHIGDVSGNSKFTVAKFPVNGLTAKQLATVLEIEMEIGAPIGAFGLDPEAKATAEKRLLAIQSAAEQVLGYVPEHLDYYKVSGTNGISIEDGEWLIQEANRGLPADTDCDGREAHTVRSIVVADGKLDFVVYYKYGHNNVAMRWRPLREGENIPAPPTSAASGEWENLGKGWWRCPLGHSEKAPKGATEVICGQCDATKSI